MPKKYLFIFGGAIGDALLGVHLGRMLSSSIPSSQITLISTRENRFVRDLLQPISFVHFVEMPKWNPRSWIILLRLCLYPHYTVFCEPITSSTSLWWQFIVRAATMSKGSIDVRCSSRTHVQQSRERIVAYDCRTDHMFDLMPRVLKQWGITSAVLLPQLEPYLYQNTSIKVSKPYLVFHFFAPSMKRSFPVSKGRELLFAAREAFPSHQMILTCTTKELPHAKRMAENIDSEILCDLPAPDVVSLIAGASAYVGVDTGITHIACHVGVPCVVLGNNSNPCWLPYYAPHAAILFELKRCGCNGNKTGDCFEETPEGQAYRCLFDIPIKSIIVAIENILAARQSS